LSIKREREYLITSERKTGEASERASEREKVCVCEREVLSIKREREYLMTSDRKTGEGR
jgi:hypothetical protein